MHYTPGMKKKIFIGTVLIGVVCVVSLVYYILRGQKSTIRSGELSERSKEYLKSSETRSETDLKYVQLTGAPEGSFNKKYTVGDCFTIQIPLRVLNERQKEGECYLYVSFARSGGSITAYQKFEGGYSDFDSVPGVSMRRLDTEKYNEKELIIHGKHFLQFDDAKEGKQTVFSFTKNSYFVVTFDIRDSEVDDIIPKTLESVEFLR